ncbi:MAG: alanine dehydrogenase [Flavobacteriales bacterium]|nr:alanine dehydrogenase [Flavobacteriales bacterium]|tara:strand:- start:15180 stop:16382 length:1203 start_codon:yes stop_codon:yes gene_type:complete
MKSLNIGLLREGKVPPDRRVVFSPKQCADILHKYPEVSIFIQSSQNRCFSDSEYTNFGVTVREDLSMCHIIMGIKEVPIDMLIDNKIFFFFSHTIKKQPYNKLLLQSILRKNIQLVDYETLTNSKNQRLIGFGRYAGIVGCYNTFLAYGKKTKKYELEFPQLLINKFQLDKELFKVSLPKNFKIILTGSGRVAKGAVEVLNLLGIKKVNKNDFLNLKFKEPVYIQLNSFDCVKKNDGSLGSKDDFYNNPSSYMSRLTDYTAIADMLITGHYFAPNNPFLLTKNDISNSKFNVKVVGDISCDIDGPIACTIRPSTIESPFYGYNPYTGFEDDYSKDKNIVVMAVDNLPCSLPRDASIHFGEVFIDKILPDLLSEKNIINRATITLNGKLTNRFSYLFDYVK